MLPLSAFFFPFNQLPLNVATNCTFGFCLRLGVLTFFFIFLFFLCMHFGRYYALFSGSHILFTRSTNTLFRKKNIKNWSHGILHTFKNYFAIVFSVFNKISGIQTDHKCLNSSFFFKLKKFN